LHVDRGQFKESEQLHTQALNIREKTLGENHPHVSHSLQGLGNAKIHLGDHSEAADLLERSLIIRQSSLGSDHPHTARSFQSLGNLKSELGDHTEAERLHQKALDIIQNRLGDDHHFSLKSLAGLARVKSHQGDHVSAESLNEKIFHIKKKINPNASAGFSSSNDSLKLLLRDSFQDLEIGGHVSNRMKDSFGFKTHDKPSRLSKLISGIKSMFQSNPS
jgi:tetratricopeptide (TPR) repeat protein